MKIVIFEVGDELPFIREGSINAGTKEGASLKRYDYSLLLSED